MFVSTSGSLLRPASKPSILPGRRLRGCGIGGARAGIGPAADSAPTTTAATSESVSSARTSVPITKTVRERTAARLSRPQKVVVQVDGTLEMADFKPKDRKCRIDPPIGPSIMCVFEPERVNDILQLLTKPVRVKGEAILQPYTDRMETVHVDEISALPSLSLGEGNFFAKPSIGELAAIQNVKPLKDPSVLAGGIPEDEDIDEFLAEIYGARK